MKYCHFRQYGISKALAKVFHTSLLFYYCRLQLQVLKAHSRKIYSLKLRKEVKRKQIQLKINSLILSFAAGFLFLFIRFWISTIFFKLCICTVEGLIVIPFNSWSFSFPWIRSTLKLLVLVFFSFRMLSLHKGQVEFTCIQSL